MGGIQVSGRDGPSLLETLLSSRRTLIVYLGSVFAPIELIMAVVKGSGIRAAIFTCLTFVLWIELAASHGVKVERLRKLEYASIIALVGLYLYYVVFRWREFLVDGF
jgi:hypothetical protein